MGLSRSLGASDIAVVYGHGGDAVQATCAGDDIRWELQAEQNGTGHAVMQAAPGVPDDNQVLINLRRCAAANGGRPCSA